MTSSDTFSRASCWVKYMQLIRVLIGSQFVCALEPLEIVPIFVSKGTEPFIWERHCEICDLQSWTTPPPISTLEKMARFGFCASSSFIRREGWSYFSPFSVEDCSSSVAKAKIIVTRTTHVFLRVWHSNSNLVPRLSLRILPCRRGRQGRKRRESLGTRLLKFMYRRVFTWRHGGHIGVSNQRNGGHVGLWELNSIFMQNLN